jgi:molybdenum cofactor cytidylyltransferase
MGRDKALLPWPPATDANSQPGTFLSASIQSLTPHTDMVFVVAGENEVAVEPIVYANGAFLLRNPDPSRGQFSSLQVGLQAVLDRGRDAAVVTLVDRPPVSLATVGKLKATFESACRAGKWAVVPQFGDKHGHPIVLGREMIEAFLKAPATARARDIEHQNQEHMLYVPVDDPFVACNVDTPQDYERVSTEAISALH